ncbi:cupin domain-containing protein [Brucella anthropi]|uniref:cupin domain-containing protein n=1 Tax=Brucella anthropi TaxID=529 RepID=UPI00124F1619|nr:cupin domain-containing protein [Brucella anthropi]KAB2785020.1 cupin domain-containing protein [Brucella anthropi]
MPVIRSNEMVCEEGPPDGPCGPNRAHWISEPGGLTQFGAFVEELPPGSRSSIKHWHSSEDEFVYVLEGAVTVVEGDAEAVLMPGDAAAFRAGDPLGHYLENRSASTTRCLVVGTRAAVDRITYPDHGVVCHRDRSLPDDIWTDGNGNPVPPPYEFTE